MASPTKNPIMKVTVNVKNAQTTEGTRGSGSDILSNDYTDSTGNFAVIYILI
jgi:hypothetical protein